LLLKYLRSGAQIFGGFWPSLVVIQLGVEHQMLPILVHPLAAVPEQVRRSVMEPLGLSESCSNPVEKP
jgi:hypothetical protein